MGTTNWHIRQLMRGPPPKYLLFKVGIGQRRVLKCNKDLERRSLHWSGDWRGFWTGLSHPTASFNFQNMLVVENCAAVFTVSSCFQSFSVWPNGKLLLQSTYFQSFRNDMFLSVSFFITFATAISKSSWVTWTLLSLRANIPASVQTAWKDETRLTLKFVHLKQEKLECFV